MSFSISETHSASIDSSLLSTDNGLNSTSSSEVLHPLHSSEIPNMEESRPRSKVLKDASTTTDESNLGKTKRLMSTSPSPIRSDSFTLRETSAVDKSFLPDASLYSQNNENTHSDWLELNNALRDHGYNPIVLSNEANSRSNLKGCLVLDKDNANSLQHTMLVMMQDCDRRQGLVQELVTSTRRLQRELDEEKMETFKLHKKATEYASTVKDQDLKIEGLELIINQPKLSQDYDSLLAECVRLRGKLRKSRKDNTVMKIELSREAYQKHELRSISILSNRSITTRPDKSHNRLNSLPLDRINSVSTQMMTNTKNLNKSNDSCQKDEFVRQYNDRLQSLERDISELKIQLVANSDSGIKLNTKVSSHSVALNDLKNSNDDSPRFQPLDPNIKQHATDAVATTNSDTSKENSPRSDSNTLLGSRPSSSSTDSNSNIESSYLFRKLKSAEKIVKQLKRIVKLLRKENKELSSKLKRRNEKLDKIRTKTKKEKVDDKAMPSNLSAKESTQKCSVNENSTKAIPDITLEGLARLLEVSPLQEEILSEICCLQKTSQWSIKANKILEVVGVTLTVIPKERSPMKSLIDHNAMDEIIPVLSTWKTELSCGRDVFVLLLDVLKTLLPLKNEHFEPLRKNADSIRISDIRSFLTDIIKDHQNGPVTESNCQNVNEAGLRQIVLHFMRLFNINNINNVFTHMTKHYMNLTEIGNVMSSIKDILELDKSASSRSVVDAVEKVSSARHLLHINDFKSAVQNLEKYDEFYHSFRSILTEIMQTLGCDCMDEVIPSLRAIVRFPQ